MSAIIKNPSVSDLIATLHAQADDRVWPDIADERFAVTVENELGYHGYEIWNLSMEPLDEEYAKDILIGSLQHSYELHWKKFHDTAITKDTIDQCVDNEITDLTDRLRDALKIAAQNAMGGKR